MTLKDVWMEITSESPNNDISLRTLLWNRIVEVYAQPNRFYHNINHIDSVVTLMKSYGCTDNAVFYAAFMHDYIYIAGYPGNEKESAIYAEKFLCELGYDVGYCARVGAMIQATASYGRHYRKSDAQVLFDADFSILGSDPDTYENYRQSIRKEFKTVRPRIYIPARISVLQKFIDMPSIFKLDWFKSRYEEQARLNISNEIWRLEHLL